MSSKVKGIMYILSAAFCFAVMTTFVKLSGDLPAIQKCFFRNLVAGIIAISIIFKNHQSIMWKKGNLPFLLIRSTCGTLGIICNFYAVDHLVLSNANMLNKISPFFGVLFSYIFLKEKCRAFQAFAIAGAFVGSLCIIQPSFSNINTLASFIGFLGGMGAGAAYTAVRYLGKRGENGSVIVFFFSAFSCLVALPFIIFDYHTMSGMQLLYLLLAGLFAAGGQFAITAAYTHAPAREISVYDYSQVIFSAILGFFLFGQLPDSLSVLGYIIICTMAVFMFIYNKREDEKERSTL